MRKEQTMLKLLMPVAVVALLSVGCARFSTKQTDVRNGETTTITTKAQAWTLFQAKSELANWKAQQSEGEQGAEVGSLNQEASSEQALEALKAIKEIVGKLP